MQIGSAIYVLSELGVVNLHVRYGGCWRAWVGVSQRWQGAVRVVYYQLLLIRVIVVSDTKIMAGWVLARGTNWQARRHGVRF